MTGLLVFLLLTFYLLLVFGLLHVCVVYDLPRAVFGLVVFVASPLVIIGLGVWWMTETWLWYRERRRIWRDQDLV